MIIEGRDIVCLTLKKDYDAGTSVKSGEVVVIIRGLIGYGLTSYGEKTREWVEEINRDVFKVTPEDEEAYITMSMFGWGNEHSVKSLMKGFVGRKKNDI